MKPSPPNTSLFGIALGLDSPWYVEDVQLLDMSDSSSKELHIYMLILEEVTNLFCPMVVPASIKTVMTIFT